MRQRVLVTSAGMDPTGVREARALAQDAFDEVSRAWGRPAGDWRLGAVLAGYAARPDINAGTRAFYEAKAARLLAGLGDVEVGGIDQAAVDGYVARRSGSPAGLKHELVLLRGALRWAAERGARVRPFRARAMPTVARVMRPLTRDEVQRLAGEFRAVWMQAAVWVLAFTGLRLAELLRLTERDVDWERGTLRLVTMKRGATGHREQVDLPLAPVALEWLGRVRPGMWGAGLRNAMRLAFARASRRWGRPISAHLLRHTFCTWVAASSRDVKTAQLLMRHRDVAMTMRYWHPADGAMRAAVDALAGQPDDHSDDQAAVGGRGKGNGQ